MSFNLGGASSDLGDLNLNDVKGKDIGKIIHLLANSNAHKDIEFAKLKLTKDFELKIKDLEKLHYERMHMTKQETKRAFDVTLENMKTIYEDEIKALKGAKKEQEEKINQLKRELVKKEGDVQLL